MTTTKNTWIILTSCGVPMLFSLALMSMVFISIPPLFLGMHERFTYGIMGSLVALLILFGFLKLEGKPWRDYALTVDKLTLVRFALGAITAMVLATTMFLLQVWYSGLEISFTSVNIVPFLGMSLSLIPLAFMEELAFRSYPLLKLKNAYGIWVAQFVIAILFALYHYIGGWTLLASFIGPGVWSFAFGLLALKSKGIALPTGFHFGLNFALAAIGNKYWVPVLFTIDFADVPTAQMLRNNEYFGASMQSIVFVALLFFTYQYNRSIHGKKQAN